MASSTYSLLARTMCAQFRPMRNTSWEAIVFTVLQGPTKKKSQLITFYFLAFSLLRNKDAVPGDGEQIWKEQVSSVKARAESLGMGMVEQLERSGLPPAVWSSKNKPGIPLGSLGFIKLAASVE